jgi:acyl-CoA thioester hydrolase
MHTPSFDRACLKDATRFRFWQEDRVRYADLDPVGHVNNNATGAYFENARVGFVDQLGISGGTPGRVISGGTPGRVIVLRRTEYDFLAEIHYPSALRIGLGVIAVGNSSLTLAGGLFVNGAVTTLHGATMVLIDAQTRRPTPLPDFARAALSAYMI